MDIVLGVIIGLVCGGLVGWLLGLLRLGNERNRQAGAAERERSLAQNLAQEQQARQDQVAELKAELGEREQQLERLRAAQQEAGATVARLEQTLAGEREASREKLALLGEAKEEMTIRFKALSAELLERSSQHLRQQHQESLSQSLKPFNEQLDRFQKQVEKAYDHETRERASLKEQLKHLTELNQRMTHEADELARALKGQSKTRGDWGEMMLERILQHSGLRVGEEYRVQTSLLREDGSRLQPDVIVDLPDNKCLVIDAKLSLISWIACVEADDDDQVGARRQLVDAIRSHMRDLSGKAYQQLYQLETVDFVLMFIPIEAAFVEALSADHGLYQEAFDRNIVLVSPSTLMAVLRTVASTWRYERQERNALRIAESAGKMYDQLVAYVASFEDVGKRIEQAHKSWDTARKRLVDGRGNLVKRAEDVRRMGAKVAKRLGKDLSELAAEADGDADGEPDGETEDEDIAALTDESDADTTDD